MPSSFVNADP